MKSNCKRKCVYLNDIKLWFWRAHVLFVLNFIHVIFVDGVKESRVYRVGCKMRAWNYFFVSIAEMWKFCSIKSIAMQIYLDFIYLNIIYEWIFVIVSSHSVLISINALLKFKIEKKSRFTISAFYYRFFLSKTGFVSFLLLI